MPAMGRESLSDEWGPGVPGLMVVGGAARTVMLHGAFPRSAWCAHGTDSTACAPLSVELARDPVLSARASDVCEK